MPQTYMANTILIDYLFEGLELTPEQVFNQVGIPTIAILWVVVAKFHTEKVWENQIFDHLQKI